jgi:hypothetical protein
MRTLSLLAVVAFAGCSSAPHAQSDPPPRRYTAEEVAVASSILNGMNDAGAASSRAFMQGMQSGRDRSQDQYDRWRSESQQREESRRQYEEWRTWQRIDRETGRP